MFDAKFQRDYPRMRTRLAADFGIVAMPGGLLGMDAQPTLTTTPNSAVLQWLSTFVDPDILRILFAPNKAAKILGGERKVGDWTTATSAFPVVEHTGDVSSYGDYAESGVAGANADFPQRQSYHYQNIVQYGEREVDMMALAKINLIAEKKEAATLALNKFQNQSYFFGIGGLQNYGLLNDPALNAPLTPAQKAYSGVKWVNGGVIVATPNEILLDIQSMYIQLVAQTDGVVELDQESKLVLAMSPTIQVALTAANSFNVDVFDLLRKNFPNIRFETAVQYATTAGQLVQMICEEVDGQKTAWPAFTEKLRAHRIVQGLSSWKQKVSQGTWGCILRQPFAVVGLLGV